MNKKEIRPLKANEVECKVGKITEKGCQLLLYKTARTDMDLLDETFGAENWECEYKEIKGNLFCGIRVYFGDRSIIKWDCGIESAFGDKEKGEASDAMKRAGFKWGIGRGLYTAPFIWIKAGDVHIEQRKDKLITFDRFSVAAIEYNEDHEITFLKIKNDTAKKIVYQYGAVDKNRKRHKKGCSSETEQQKIVRGQRKKHSPLGTLQAFLDLMRRQTRGIAR